MLPDLKNRSRLLAWLILTDGESVIVERIE